MEKIKKIKKLLKNYNLDGYIIPKNDEFFGEYVPDNKDNLKFTSNFTGSYGFALILKNQNYIFVDGRYTLQAQIQCGGLFKVITIPNKLPYQVLNNKKLSIGFDPRLHTNLMLDRFFIKTKCKLIAINQNLVNLIRINKIVTKKNNFYKLNDKDAGESSKSKIKKIKKILINNKADYQFISAPENVAWLLNLRGKDSDFAPIPNSYFILNKNKKSYLFCDLKKVSSKLKAKLGYNLKVVDIKYIENFINKIKNKTFQIDLNSCSVFFKNLIKKEIAF